MRPVRILLRLKRRQSRTVKVFANVREHRRSTPAGQQLYPKQLHLGYFSAYEGLDEDKKDALFRALVDKWPRNQKPKAIDWHDAEIKLSKLRSALDGRQEEALNHEACQSQASSSPELDISTSSVPNSDPAMQVAPEELAETIALLKSIATTWSGNSFEADDLVQAALERAFRTPRHLPGSSFRTWMIVIMRNLHIDYCRRRRRERLVNIDEISEILAEPEIAEEQWKNVRTKDVLVFTRRLAADKRLTSDQCRLIELNLQGLSYSQMAQILGVPLSVVRSRLHRARCILATEMREGYDSVEQPGSMSRSSR